LLSLKTFSKKNKFSVALSTAIRGLDVNISRVLASLLRDGYVRITKETFGKRVYELTKDGLKEAFVKSKQSPLNSWIYQKKLMTIKE
jgi:hypothetical protein